jgi:long-chain fatty acid transport protein
VYDSTTLIAPTIFQQQPVLKGLKTLLTLKTTGVGWNGSLGMIYTPTSKVQVGLTYRTPTAINSSGSAVGNLSALLAALGLTGKFQQDFRYSTKFNYTLPQIGRVGVAWGATPRTKVFASADFVGWGNAFDHLGLTTSNGTNADLNGLVGSNGFSDVIPLNWSNQTIVHAGVERVVKSNLILRGGFMAGNNPVPSSTLTPLTAAITRASVGGGVGYHRGRYTLDAGYMAGLPNSASVGQSILRAGEYNNSKTEISTQTLATTFAVAF